MHSWLHVASCFSCRFFPKPAGLSVLQSVRLQCVLLLLHSALSSVQFPQAEQSTRRSCRNTHRRAARPRGGGVKSPIISPSAGLCCALDTLLRATNRFSSGRFGSTKRNCSAHQPFRCAKKLSFPSPRQGSPLVDSNNLEIMGFKTCLKKVS